MQNINWDMMTQFVFPEQLGLVDEVITCNIIPRWQQVETEDSIQLNGIYHITAVARFNPYEIPQYSEGTLIEELEFDGNNGYFEYALPLNIDLPRNKIAPNTKPDIQIADVSFFVYDGCSCTFKWEVNCSFEEPVEGALFQHEAIPEIPIVNDYRSEQNPEFTEEIRFGHDAIFPEDPTRDENPNFELEQGANVGQTIQFGAPVQENAQAPDEEIASYEGSAPIQGEVPVQNLEQVQEEEPNQAKPEPVQNLEQAQEKAPVQNLEQVQEESSVQTQNQEQEDESVQNESEAQEESPALLIRSSIEKVHEASVNAMKENNENDSVEMATNVVVDEGIVIEDMDKKNITEEPAKREKVIQSNRYFPTDTDDFYNDLTESYTILSISNKIRNE